MSERPDPPIRQKPPAGPRARPPAMGPAAADNAALGRPAPAPRERLVPKPLQRVLGFVILFFTVGMLSCQAMVN